MRALWPLAALLAGTALAASYTVRPGDTLYSLARGAGLTVPQLQQLNHLTGTDLQVGQVLELPGAPQVPAEVPALPPAQVPAQPPALPPAAEPGAPRPAVRVSRPGCCVDAQWTAHGDTLLYLDRPPGGAVGLYRVPADGSAPGGTWALPPTLLSGDGAYGLQPAGRVASALRLSDGARATVPTKGGEAVWSPGGMLAWPTYASAQRDDWVPMTVVVGAPFAPGGAAAPRRRLTVYGGRLVGWLNDRALLLTGRLKRQDERRALLTLDVPSGQVRVLAQGQQFSGVRAAPDGRRVVYRVTLDRPGRNGMFVLDVGAGTSTPLGLFGSARWQDDTHLLVIPYEPGRASQRLVRLDTVSGETQELGALQDKVSSDDWQVAPDGTRLVYLSALDKALRVLSLPESLSPAEFPEPARP